MLKTRYVAAVVLAIAGMLCTTAYSNEALRLNDIQVLGSHNSYKQPIDESLYSLLLARDEAQAKALQYSHPSLRKQLNMGLRMLELDLFYDPEGGRYMRPAGLEIVEAAGLPPGGRYDARMMTEPGFKVLHVQDLDFRSSCQTLKACLTIVRNWSNENPGHLPIAISFNAKQAPLPGGLGTTPIPFDRAAFDALDETILDLFDRDQLLLPDDVRGTKSTLRMAVMTEGWPTTKQSRGRFLFILDETGAQRDAYLEKNTTLAGRTLFPTVDEDHPAAAIMFINDPIADGARIRRLARDGFLVRTRADADTWEARNNDGRRRSSAFASGAHFVSTDYYEEGNPFGTDYLVQLPKPGTSNCNPVTSQSDCKAPPDFY